MAIWMLDESFTCLTFSFSRINPFTMFVALYVLTINVYTSAFAWHFWTSYEHVTFGLNSVHIIIRLLFERIDFKLIFVLLVWYANFKSTLPLPPHYLFMFFTFCCIQKWLKRWHTCNNLLFVCPCTIIKHKHDLS